MFLAASPSHSQTPETTALIREMGNLHAATSRLDELTRIAGQISYVETVALLSYQGSWKGEKNNYPSEWVSPFFYDVEKLSERLGDEVVKIGRSAEQDKALGDGERRDFELIAVDVEVMLAESTAFYDLLHAGKMDEANAFYRDRTRALYSSVQNASYTLRLTLNDRIMKLSRKARSMK
jgi:hypothetical protein